MPPRWIPITRRQFPSPDPLKVEDVILALRRAIGEGQPETALSLAANAVSFVDRAAELHALHGLLLRQSGDVAGAESAFKKALTADNRNAEALLNLAQLWRAQGRLLDAAEILRHLRLCHPDLKEACQPFSETLAALGKVDELATQIVDAERLAVATPAYFVAVGNGLHAMGNNPQAAKIYQRALAIDPSNEAACFNLSIVLAACGDNDGALDALRRLVGAHPLNFMAWARLAELLRLAGHWGEAAAAYGNALEIDPAQNELRVNKAFAYSRLGRWQECFDEAYKAWENGCRAPVAFLNMGNALHALRRHAEALHWYRAGLAEDPGYLALRTEAIHVQQKVCDWQGFATLRQDFLEPVLAEEDAELSPSPFACVALPLPVSPAELKIVADRYARQIMAAVKPLPPIDGIDGKRPIRVGYLSADFHNHATAHLMLGLFGRHDRRYFSIHAYSLGADDGSHYRQRIVADCDAFTDLSMLSDREAAERIRADGIDVLIDLKGYTGGARPWVLACRPAPIQVNYLGYPGTMGSGFMDYIVADPVVLPPEEFADYGEAPVLLPHCYQVNDSDQPIAEDAGTRAGHGLPEDGFVFCCFNSPYKIEPTVFALWMRLLQAVPGSVLWLFAGDPLATENLRKAAEAAGVDPDRLVFAPKLPKPEHLARHRHADLFLDTLYYNAHTTASDALWAGVPVLTCQGGSFAGRVAASLLHAVGLDELIVHNLADYERLALQLVNEPAALAALKAKLAANCRQAPLFDTALFARHLEISLEIMVDRRKLGQAPSPIIVHS
jgi:predicted O-linked N-acetylglucosamine transferase (SPINDLY family)